MRVAIYQADAGPTSPAARLAQLDKVLRNYTDPVPDLVLCPELFVSGYGDAKAIHQAAGAINSEWPRQLAAIASRHGIAIASGYPELDTDRDLMFNSAVCFSAQGTLLDNHRKRVLPTPYEKALFDTGNTTTIFSLDNGWRVAVLICYEVEFPEAVRTCALAGAQLILVPTALGRDWQVVSRQLVPSRAFENNVFLAYANYAGEDPRCRYIGDSVICSPMGADLARAGDAPELIQAQLDTSAIDSARARLPYLVDYSRLN